MTAAMIPLGLQVMLLLTGIAVPPGAAGASAAVLIAPPARQVHAVERGPVPDGAADLPWRVEVEQVDGGVRLNHPSPVVSVLTGLLYAVLCLICVYTARHYLFTLSRLFGRQRHPYVPIDAAAWPSVTVLVPCHNEEAVINNILDALLRADYPEDRLLIMPVNDRSTDWTQPMIDTYAKVFPNRIRPFHRTEGRPGKAAALKDAAAFLDTEIMLVFDADYVPGPDLIKQLVAPFLDPEVGAVMGRVVPLNTQCNLLTALLEMERAGGYQVDQQARMNLRLIPQYGGTVGGVRLRALEGVGGWREDTLTEDTDLTCRLLMGGWKVVYSNRYECYEEVPETWPVRVRQIKRWARGHTDTALCYAFDLLKSRHLRWRERLDALLLLGIYFMSPLLLLAWTIALVLVYTGASALNGLLLVLALASFNTFGNFAAFFEIAVAMRLDGTRRRIRLLPFVLVGFLVSLFATAQAALSQLRPRSYRKKVAWDKTVRYRDEPLYEMEGASGLPQPGAGPPKEQPLRALFS